MSDDLTGTEAAIITAGNLFGRVGGIWRHLESFVYL